MSRPFSYNDENFTVIGNIVFMSLKYSDAFDKDTPTVKVPEEIYKRLNSYTCLFFRSYDDPTSFDSYIIRARIGSDRKIYFVEALGKATVDRYFYGFLRLKDI